MSDLRLTFGFAYSVSPGNRLAALIDRMHVDYKSITEEKRAVDMNNYDLFPMYPTGKSVRRSISAASSTTLVLTAFLIAANIVLEIHGESSSVQSHLSNSSTSGSLSLSYGPFTLGGSASHSKDSSTTSCSATAAGCKLVFNVRW